MSGKNQTSNGIRITGFGHYLPERIVTNEEIRSRLKFPEMHPAEKAVIGNIGVNERRRANETETAMFMASKVAEMALKDAGKNRKMWIFIFSRIGPIVITFPISLPKHRNFPEPKTPSLSTLVPLVLVSFMGFKRRPHT
ncbi:3-oxoacyl-(acyl carrier protein) synthase III domain protein [Leptospira weilii serovar Topaz str. LT2116]|uniref:3-oxoacyl-(Acyl carrier protein) synthase III domain protein n=1 Tax=Leptospira weilii serovar Topaz str. LT2116 TaxID=1088540 RepID=M3FU04_9LEPT|nr:3-oxoacyl-(acyl carrier protein) synthase III domain protein [Leptospira weilii serovar Topaz str. LT2116]